MSVSAHSAGLVTASPRGVVVNTEQSVREVVANIQRSGAAVIAVDCEGEKLSRFGRLCLVQVAVNDEVYLFDPLSCDVFEAGLRQLLMQEDILKVIHDCREDSAALFWQYGVKLTRVFDTQVAYRMRLQADQVMPFNVGLNTLLDSYLGERNNLKDQFRKMMKTHPSIWTVRPLTDDMNLYASSDVIFLTQLKDHLLADLNVTEEAVIKASQTSLDYGFINELVRGAESVKISQHVQGVVRHLTDHCAYIGMNLGWDGVVTNQKDVNKLSSLPMGQVVSFRVSEIKSEWKRFTLELPKSKTENATPSLNRDSPVSRDEMNPHRLGQRQKQIDLGKQTEEYKRYQSLVERDKRDSKECWGKHPVTPDIRQSCSKRAWEGQVRKWRRLLHAYYDATSVHVMSSSSDHL
eukprot:GILJ01002259.1.p1 GENE.GILJ01002259.1~~GILJ01002259.1.p1  ORF type:complete len:406 (-),score=37.07 GILJ01002259.1:446-1663(-)